MDGTRLKISEKKENWNDSFWKSRKISWSFNLISENRIRIWSFLIVSQKRRIYRHFKRILGDPEVTANLGLFPVTHFFLSSGDTIRNDRDTIRNDRDTIRNDRDTFFDVKRNRKSQPGQNNRWPGQNKEWPGHNKEWTGHNKKWPKHNKK